MEARTEERRAATRMAAKFILVVSTAVNGVVFRPLYRFLPAPMTTAHADRHQSDCRKAKPFRTNRKKEGKIKKVKKNINLKLFSYTNASGTCTLPFHSFIIIIILTQSLSRRANKKKAHRFSLMVAGQAGLGKTTLLATLFEPSVQPPLLFPANSDIPFNVFARTETFSTYSFGI